MTRNHRSLSVTLFAAIFVLLALGAGGCSHLFRTEITDVSRYEEMRARVASRVAPAELEGFPDHIPPMSTQTRMKAVFGERSAGLALYCKFMPAEARRIADEARTHAIRTRSGMEKKPLERMFGVQMPPEQLELIVLIDTRKDFGLGGFSPEFYGTSAEVIVAVDSGVVIWELLHSPPLPPSLQSSSDPIVIPTSATPPPHPARTDSDRGD